MNQITTNQLTKKRKKKGFTLIELIAVIAIIGILAAVLVPRVIGYMNDGKRSKIIAQCRTFVMAVETYNGKEVSPVAAAAAGDPTLAELNTAVTASSIDYSEYFDTSALDSIANTITYSQAKMATDGKKADGTIAVVDITTMPWAGAFE